MKLQIKIKKEECTDSCPLPLSTLVTIEKGIRAVDYDKKKEQAVINFNENIISKKEVMQSMEKMKYNIIKEVK